MGEAESSKLTLFEGKSIRKILCEGKWWFSLIDVISVLVGGNHSRKYWNDLKQKLLQEGYLEVFEKIGQLNPFKHWKAHRFLVMETGHQNSHPS